MKDRTIVSAIARAAIDRAVVPLERRSRTYKGLFSYIVMVAAECGDGVVSQAQLGISADVFEIVTVDAMNELIKAARCDCDRCVAARERFGKCLEILQGYEAPKGSTVQ